MAKLILGLCGEMGSGKGTIAQYIIEKKDGSTHRFSTMLRDVLDRLFIEQSRDNLQVLSTFLRKTYGEDILAKVMFHEVANDNHQVVVIDGIRRMSDIAFLLKLPEFKLVYVEVPMETRFARISDRAENADDKTKSYDEFIKANQNEAEIQIRDLKDKAAIVLENSGSIDDLQRRIDEIIQSNI